MASICDTLDFHLPNSRSQQLLGELGTASWNLILFEMTRSDRVLKVIYYS